MLIPLDEVYVVILVAAVIAVVIYFRKSLLSAVAAFIMIAAILYLAYPAYTWAQQALTTVYGIHATNIHEDAIKNARSAVKTMRSGKPVPVEQLDKEEAQLGYQGAVGRRQVLAERKALAELKGIRFGQFGIPANMLVKRDPITWYNTKRMACPGDELYVWGMLHSNPRNRNFDWVTPQGSHDHPDYDHLPKVMDNAMHMALIVQIGVNGTPQYDWTPVSGNKYKVVLSGVSGNCGELLAAINDYVGDPAMYRTSFFAQNRGSVPMDIDNPNGGLQAELREP